jgi:8-oxo-dGTP pyrophosphatase MutT (NUDIX family)
LKNNIRAAGGIVFQGKKILFIKKNGRWEFPKGRLKKGSKRKTTALREIYEETGIPKGNLKIIKSLIPTHDNVKVGKDVVMKKTFWYLIEFLGDAKIKLVPEKKEGITKCKWLTSSEIVLIMKDSRPLVHYLLEFVLQDIDYKRLRKPRRK